MITVDYSFVAFRVAGLAADTCHHCIDSLKAELTGLPGVLGVDIAPDQGKVSVLVDDLTAAECAADALWDAGWDAVDAASDRRTRHCWYTPGGYAITDRRPSGPGLLTPGDRIPTE